MDSIDWLTANAAWLFVCAVLVIAALGLGYYTASKDMQELLEKARMEARVEGRAEGLAEGWDTGYSASMGDQVRSGAQRRPVRPTENPYSQALPGSTKAGSPKS